MFNLRAPFAALIALASFSSVPAFAQLAPAITPPATGSEQITCYQSGVPKTCTSAQIQKSGTQTANTVLAAPNGSSGAPTFRTLAGADIPAVSLTTSGAGGISGILPPASGGTGAIKLRSLFVSSAATNGEPVGNDSNAGTSAAPLLTLQAALALAAPSADIFVNGALAPAAASNYLISSPVTIMGIIDGAATFTPAAGQSNIFELAASGGGNVTISGVVLNTSGTSANAVFIDGVSGGQTVNVTNVTGNVGGNFIDSASNSSLNLNVTGGSISGTGRGINLSALNSGKIAITNWESTLTPSAAGGISGETVYIDGNGTGATAGSVSATLTNLTVATTYPTNGSSAIVKDIDLENTNGVVTGGSYAMNSQSGDTNTSCRPVTIDSDTGHPLATTIATLSNYTVTNNCAGGGHGGATIGYDGWPQGAQFTGVQAGTTLTVSGLSGAVWPGEQIVGGASWSGTPETIVSQLTGTPGAAGTYQASVSQTLVSGTLYAGALNFVSNGIITGIKSVGGTLNLGSGNPIEGGAFCGWETGVVQSGNLSFNNSYGAISKGCTNDTIETTLVFSRDKNAIDLKGSTGTSVLHNTIIAQTNPVGGNIGYAFYFEQDNGDAQPNYPWSTGVTVSGNLVDGAVASNNLRFEGFYNTCTTSCISGTGANSVTFTYNDWFNPNGPGSGFPFYWDNTTSLLTYANFAVWQAAHEATAVNYDPQLTNAMSMPNSTYSNWNISPLATSLAITGSSAIAVPDYYGNKFATTPSFGAAAFQGGVTAAQIAASLPIKGNGSFAMAAVGVAGTTYYAPLYGYMAAVQTAQSGVETLITYNTTLKNLYANVNLAPGNTFSDTIQVNDNGTATGITCTISNTSTTCNDTTHTFNASAGDMITFQFSTIAGGTPGKWSGAVELDQR